MCVQTWHLSTFVSMFAPCEGCPYICVFTGKLNVLARTHHSAANICPSLLSVFAAGVSREMGSTGRAASILSVLREIRHEIKAPIKGQG